MTAALVALSTTSTAVELIPELYNPCAHYGYECPPQMEDGKLEDAIKDFVMVTRPKTQEYLAKS